MYNTKQFQHDGRNYEVRIASDGQTYHVRVFENGKPANGYSYSVTLEVHGDFHTNNTDINAKEYTQSTPLKELINTAINDVKNGIWEQYVSALKDSISPQKIA